VSDVAASHHLWLGLVATGELPGLRKAIHECCRPYCSRPIRLVLVEPESLFLSITSYHLFLFFLLATNTLVIDYISLQHLPLTHKHINISYVSLLSLSQYHYSIFDYFRIYFMNNKFEKNEL
jgi:hypothetical protein